MHFFGKFWGFQRFEGHVHLWGFWGRKKVTFLKNLSSQLFACVWIMWTLVVVSWLSFINSPAHHLLTAASFDRLAQHCWLFIFSSQWPGDLVIVDLLSLFKGNIIHSTCGDQVNPTGREANFQMWGVSACVAWRGGLVTPKSGIRRCRAGHATKIRLQKLENSKDNTHSKLWKPFWTKLPSLPSSYPLEMTCGTLTNWFFNTRSTPAWWTLINQWLYVTIAASISSISCQLGWLEVMTTPQCLHIHLSWRWVDFVKSISSISCQLGWLEVMTTPHCLHNMESISSWADAD